MWKVQIVVVACLLFATQVFAQTSVGTNSQIKTTNPDPDATHVCYYLADMSGGHTFGTPFDVCKVVGAGGIHQRPFSDFDLVQGDTKYVVVTWLDAVQNESVPSNEIEVVWDGDSPSAGNITAQFTIIIPIE